MITCEHCGKIDGSPAVGDHWICGDCNATDMEIETNGEPSGSNHTDEVKERN